MADFCMQCAAELGFDGPDLDGITNPILEAAGFHVVVLCEGCGPTSVDSKGRCVSHLCLAAHGNRPGTKQLGQGPLDLHRDEAAAFLRGVAHVLTTSMWRNGLKFGWENGKTYLMQNRAVYKRLSGLLSRRRVAKLLNELAMEILTTSELVALRFELYNWTLITEPAHWRNGRTLWGHSAESYRVDPNAS